MHPPAQVRFPPLLIGDNAQLSFGCGIKPACWDRMGGPVQFELLAVRDDGAAEPLFTHTLDPRRNPADRKWHDVCLDLERFGGQTIQFDLKTTATDGGDTSYCWAGWSDPQLKHERPAPQIKIRTGQLHHIVLITADAVRFDHLGCYGQSEVRTPHVDRLAEHGCLFTHARGQTPATLGAYSSLLTSTFPWEHGIVNEFGQLPRRLLTLPAFLKARGYHTLLASGELELTEPTIGLSDTFDEQLPCLGRPAQDGAITVRALSRWLDRRPDRPCFLWIELFDGHPPSMPPQPYRSLYYPHDPTDAARTHDPEKVRQIAGCEIVNSMNAALPLLEEGVVDVRLTRRLAATAHALKVGIPGPDLATHLRKIGPSLWNHMAFKDFVRWLNEQVAHLVAGEVPGELLAWLRTARAALRTSIESDILSWLDDVVDYRYPLAQYQGAVSYCDELVGRILSELQKRGIYENSTVIFATPHGETLSEYGIHFHHHDLLESASRTATIIKPAACFGTPTGTRVDGIFDAIDLFPTLIELLGLESFPGLSGTSRWPQIRTGTAIPPHPSFAVAESAASCSVVVEPYKLIHVLETHRTSEAWQWRQGDQILFDLRTGEDRFVNAEHPQVLADLDSQLSNWMHACGQGHLLPKKQRLAKTA